MYRLLIVDDETIIADGLYEVFSQLDSELDVCKAYSGMEALAIMKSSRVDIVLTDIRMPGIDGIQLMERIRKEWPHCRVIFLTGYDEFDYVYKAIQSPGVSYILKTEGYRKVKELVRATVEQLDQELFTQDLVKQSEERLHTLDTLLQGEYMRHVLKGARQLEELEADFKQLHIPLDPTQPVIAVLGVLTIPVKQDTYVSRQQTAIAVKLIAEPFLQGKVKVISVLDRYQDVLWLIQPNGDRKRDSESTVKYVEGVFELVEQACSNALELTLAITLADEAIRWERLSTVYEKLRQLQSNRIGDGTHMVQTVHMKEADDTADCSFTGAMNQRSLVEQSDVLAMHLECGREEEFYAVFDKLAATLEDEADPAVAMQLYYAIALVLLTHINRLHMASHAQVNIKSLMSMDDHHSRSAGYNYLKQTAALLFAHRQSGEQNRAAQAVADIRAYIEEHLHEDLSLVRLAAFIHFNPSYLSRMFKQECGFNLSEYIVERRVKKALELLQTHELKIAEVGAKVGYDSPHSFTRFFKKMTGLTPQEYRDKRS